MTTPQDIINLALKDAGVVGLGQTASAEDTNDSFIRLNWMVSSWARKRWLIPHLINVSVVSTGAQSYSIGPGGDINVSVRPDGIASAFMRQNPGSSSSTSNAQTITPSGSPFVYIASQQGTVIISGGTVSAIFYSSATVSPGWVVATSPVVLQAGDAVQVVYTVAPAMSFTPANNPTVPSAVPTNAIDYKLRVIQAREDYDRIVMKGMAPNFSYSVFYDTNWPLGFIYTYPAAAVGFELHFTIKAILTEFTSLTQDINLPNEFKAALHFNLADRLRVAYQIPVAPNDKLAGWARDALQTIRKVNTQVPTLTMPNSIRTRAGSDYNIISDTYQP